MLLVSGFRGSAAPQDPPGTAALVALASAYVRDYQQQLTAIVADETYHQEIRTQVPRDRGMPDKRTMKGEIFFWFTPGSDWMAIRDVVEVDGRTPHDRPDLRAALRLGETMQVAAAFKAHNARYNLGHITRNFNEPTLGLLVLDDRHRGRFTFVRGRTDRRGGETLVTLTFRERGRDTLIRGLDGTPVPSRGEVTLEVNSGRITRTLLAATIGKVQVTMSTSYGHEPRLDMWVPERFGERYRDGAPGLVPYEDIQGEATYANFRRFEVLTRIR
ncbi:MAG: hypothetical protein H0X44_01290 [Acidobacteria bacterium]|nr:hypothetical protein [Acidobacteriota bacterium]